MTYITLTPDSIGSEHICCAFSDKKCAEGYALKKEWLLHEFENGYIFRRLNERAKVFIEHGPAEKAWVPITAPEYMMLGCFWVSGQYKGQGHGKALLQEVVDDARKNKKQGLVTVAGAKKFPFMSDTNWLLRQGFEVVDTTPAGFSLLSISWGKSKCRPQFNESARSGQCPHKRGLVVYYSNRCPYTEYHVGSSLVETAKKRKLPLKVIKLETLEQAKSSPTPATIFSLFIHGRFVTTDISVCMDSRFDKIVGSTDAYHIIRPDVAQ
jgi:GNAT superfamily N-acetyltransferase